MKLYQYEITTKAGADVLSVTLESGYFRFNPETGRAENTIYAKAEKEKAYYGADSFRVMPVNPVHLALHCTVAAARAAANRGGKAAEVAATVDSDSRKTAEEKAAKKAGKQSRAARNITTQETIYGDLRRLSAALAAALATDNSISLDEYIFRAMADTSAQTQDFFSVAVVAALESAESATDRAAAVFAALNRYIRGNKAIFQREVSTEYIIDGGGDLVSFGTAAAAILKGGEKWTPAAGVLDLDSKTAEKLSAALAGAAALLTPAQRKIWLFTVRGYSAAQTAAACNYSAESGKRTVQRHMDIIRKTVADYIEKTSPDLARDFVKTAEVATAATAAKKDRHSADYMREYMKARRAAKKAAALAAAK